MDCGAPVGRVRLRKLGSLSAPRRRRYCSPQPRTPDGKPWRRGGTPEAGPL